MYRFVYSDDRRQMTTGDKVTIGGKVTTGDQVATGDKVTTGGNVTTQQLVRSLATYALVTGEPRTTDIVLDMRFVTGVIKYQVCRRTFSIIGKVTIAINRLLSDTSKQSVVSTEEKAPPFYEKLFRH